MGAAGSTRKQAFGPTGNKAVALLGIAVASACLALSLWSTWRVAGLTHDVWRARHWVMVQANVLHVSSAATRDPRRLGYFPTRIKYRYTYGGRQYEAGRLVFTEETAETADIWDGRWLAAVTDFIEDTRREGRPLPVFINPADPADAVVFRDMVWGNFILDALLMLLLGLLPIVITRLALPRWCSAATAKAAQIGIGLLLVAFALACAAVAAAA